MATIRNVTEYIESIGQVKTANKTSGNKAELLFRGQPTDKPLLPKLARLDIENKLRGKIANIENLILNEFKRGIIPLSEFQPQTDWDVIALAQHHGLPTRLLDWTYSALTALWFAVCQPPKKDSDGKLQKAVIWILAANTEDFRLDTEKTTPFDSSPTKIFRSAVITRRISAQSGVFTVHKIDPAGKIIKFETHKEFKHKLTKIAIPPNAFSSIRKELNMLGVNNATIFPDIDGFCKHLEWRFSYYDDEMKKTPGKVK